MDTNRYLSKQVVELSERNSRLSQEIIHKNNERILYENTMRDNKTVNMVARYQVFKPLIWSATLFILVVMGYTVYKTLVCTDTQANEYTMDCLIEKYGSRRIRQVLEKMVESGHEHTAISAISAITGWDTNVCALFLEDHFGC
jgi:hypothetical protein